MAQTSFEVSETRGRIEETFRKEYGRLVAALVGYLGDVDRSEEALQEALARALLRWSRAGVPENPAGWLYVAAKNIAVDAIRRDRRRHEKYRAADAADHYHARDHAMELHDVSIPDERLRLIFMCCHPSLSIDAQVSLTLRLVGGLTVEEIASAFLVKDATIAQRLVRARRKIRAAGIPFVSLSGDRLRDRLDAVLAVVYLIFNEGYLASGGATHLRSALTSESIHLARVLKELLPRESEISGILALMLLQDARRDARLSADGEPVLLEDQDRTLWDGAAIAEGIAILDRLSAPRLQGPYVIQARIAAEHSRAPRAGQTDWNAVVRNYDALLEISPSPVVVLNRAVAVAMVDGPDRAIEIIESTEVATPLVGYLWFHSTRAELLRRAGRLDEAAEAYRTALSLPSNDRERAFLRTRLFMVGSDRDQPDSLH